MATSSSASAPVGPETPIIIKIAINHISANGLTLQIVQKKVKLPLADLVPSILPGKLSAFVGVVSGQSAVFERFSDSSASYVNLDPTNHHAYKTLYRAAKAKLKLRLRVTLGPDPNSFMEPTFNETLKSLANLNFGHDTLSSSSGFTVGASGEQPATPVSAVAMEADTTPSSIASDVSTAASAIAASAPPPAAEPIPGLLPSSVQHPTCHRDEYLAQVRSSQEKLSSKIRKRRSDLVTMQALQHVSMRLPPNVPANATVTWSVFCNDCDKPMLGEHYHCNICENGDYDLCTDCVTMGKHCLDEKHWLIKRLLKGTDIINSTTEKVTRDSKSEAPQGMPGAFTEEKKSDELEKPTRTCNCCVKVFSEDAFVTCSDCEDYDLCVPCLQESKHGHHPGHTFEPATRFTMLSMNARTLCKPGRNVNHAAICDECNERIVGVRHKCLICPDWDYCSKCVVKAPSIHRGHRFAPIYDMIPVQYYTLSPTHVGVYCDGPLCKDKNTNIAGIRYKCAICPDIDFCASCEASPSLVHNRTHPFLKFRNPVRACKVTMMPHEEEVTRAAPVEALSSATQIHTVAEVKPTVKTTKEKIEIKDLLVDTAEPLTKAPIVEDSKAKLHAYFIRDTISDGTIYQAGRTFTQHWTLKNPGPSAWPAGCSVRYVGGDNMLNVDDQRPSSDSDYMNATESNVIRRAVEVGEDVTFRVTMKAPAREGVAISYWRIKTADDTPFGHRLWCHIKVAGQTRGPANDTAREIGRLGKHDDFLRHTLKEHLLKRTNPSDTIRGALQKTCTAKMHAQLMDIERIQPQPVWRSQYAQTGGDLIDSVKAEPVSKSQSITDNAIEAVEEAVKAMVPTPTETSVSPEEAPIETTTATQDDKPAPFVFPTLEKESPASSTQLSEAATDGAAAKNVLVVEGMEPSEDVELFDDAENLSLVEVSDESESGFLTEDEYDILDASDEDTT